MKYNGRFHAPQYGGRAKPIEESTSVLDTEKSATDARNPDSSQEKPSPFWYPRDLELPEEIIPAKPFQGESRRERVVPTRNIPVTIRKKRMVER